MLFNSLAFLIFLPATLTLYYLAPRRAQNHVILASSWFFYGWWSWQFLGLLVGTTIIDYWVGRGLGAAKTPRVRRLLLVASLTISLGVLGLFKYAGFFAEALVRAGRTVGLDLDVPLLQLVLPVGISFYTFQTMNYVIDVYRGKLAPTRSFVDFATFVSFWPHLVAGPILRATVILPQVQSRHTLDADGVREGARLALWGLFKKVVIADNLNRVVERAFVADASGSLALLGAYAFGLQIYCDFSGYSDIAKGCARFMGFELPWNFRAPYLATSIGDFWRRWHISLSTWFRDYVYLPLGGSRGSRARHLFNLLVTFLLSGLWHGAHLRFVVWGAIHGLAYVPEVLRRGRTSPPSGLRRFAGWLVTLHVVMLAWLFFRADTLSLAGSMLWSILTWHHAGTAALMPAPDILRIVAAGAIVLGAELLSRGDHPLALTDRGPLYRTAVTAGLFFFVCTLGNFDDVPFIYFQF